VRSAHESWAQKKVLGRIAGRRELREDDDVRGCSARVGERREDPLPVAVEIPDDDVQLSERDPQGFRLTVTNRV
jgi:hypothetical protein